jgi:hypothetical protein
MPGEEPQYVQFVSGWIEGRPIAEYDVEIGSELWQRLVAEGRLDPATPGGPPKPEVAPVVVHHPEWHNLFEAKQ